MLAYEKTMLEVYVKTKNIIDLADAAFMKKALTPYRRGMTALAQAEELIGMIEKKNKLIRLYSDITVALNSIALKFRRILGEKYGFFTDGDVGIKDRGYYRKLSLATYKFSEAMKSMGYTEEKYAETIDEFAFIGEIYSEILSAEKKARDTGKLCAVGSTVGFKRAASRGKSN